MSDITPPPSPEPLPAEIFDSHCHLDAMGCRTADEVARAVRNAHSVGVTRVLTVADTLASAMWCSKAAEDHSDVFAVVAVHPNESDSLDQQARDKLTKLAHLPQVRGIGETGLDYFRDQVDVAVQQEAFRWHIDLAKQCGKPLVIHDRDAHDDVLKILAEEGAPQWTVFHCFSGDAEMARICVDQGYYLSFSGTVTFKNAPKIKDAAKIVPLNQLLVETDAPFLTPTPYRGSPNAPYLLPLTVGTIAELKGVAIDELCAAIMVTGERLFGPW